MYARLIEFSGADPEKRERAIQTIRETVIPMLRQYDGFAGYITLYDGENNRAKAVLLWETEEAAKETDRNAEKSRQGTVDATGVELLERGRYEVVAQL